MSKRNHPIDAVEDLWTIFECPECGILYWSEERIYQHLKKIHDIDPFNTPHDKEPTVVKIFSVELIRAIPQDEKGGKKE